MKNHHAFTLIEIIIVLVIVGLVTAIGLPGINKARVNAETETMRARAVQLETSKAALVDTLSRDTAINQWNAQGTDANRYANLLRQYLPSSFPAALTTLIPSPYTITLGDIDNPVTLKNSGTTISLQKY